MLIYLGAFAVSVGIAAYGEHLRTKKNNEKGFYLCLALAVLVMAVLAGLRDPSIGTDSVVYEEWVADAKLQDGLLACIRQRHKTEPLFMTLVYLAAHVFGDVHWLYFMVDLLACGLFMIGLVQYKEYVSVPYGWLAYLCLYYGDTYNAERQSVALGCVTGLMVMRLLTPVQQMIAASRAIGKSEFDTPDIPLPKQPEIARLAESFNIMKHSMAQQVTTLQEKNEIERELHRQKTEALELQNRMERSRLQQLRSQIDPHFLFNTLNVIQQTAGTETAYRTQALIMALSHLLRYSLMSNDEQVPLSREVRIVDEYYSIYHVRFGERVRMEWRISDSLDLTETMVPSFILQPIVENAFKHGICPKEEGGVVRIRVNPLREKGLLCIRVVDNGVGIQLDQLRQLRGALSQPGERWEHIGIYNVAARLRLLDRNSRFVIRSHPGRGTAVVLYLPLVENEEEFEE